MFISCVQLYSTAKTRAVKLMKVYEEVEAPVRSNLSGNNALEGEGGNDASTTSQDLKQRKRSRSPMQDDRSKKDAINQVFRSMDDKSHDNQDYYQIISSNENSKDGAPSSVNHAKAMEENDDNDDDDNDDDDNDDDDKYFLIAYPPIDKRTKYYFDGML